MDSDLARVLERHSKVTYNIIYVENNPVTRRLVCQQQIVHMCRCGGSSGYWRKDPGTWMPWQIHMYTSKMKLKLVPTTLRSLPLWSQATGPTETPCYWSVPWKWSGVEYLNMKYRSGHHRTFLSRSRWWRLWTVHVIQVHFLKWLNNCKRWIVTSKDEL
jgi:hypothetical protein